MKATESGIEVSKAELACLLLFAGKTDFAVVHFRVNGHRKLVVSAGDGKRSVQCTAPGGDAETGEWAVPAFFLERVRRTIDKGRTDALLEFTAKGLKAGHLVGAASRAKQLRLEDETNSTSTQVSIEELRQLSRNTPLTGSWFALAPKQVGSALTVLSKAADDCPVTYYPPQESKGLLLLECSSEDGCRWLAALPTALVDEPGGETAEPEEEDDTPGKLPASKQPELPGTDGEDDDEDEDEEEEPSAEGDDSGVVDDSYAEKLKTQKTPRKEAAKKSGKKAAKKGAKKK